jgi:hypothetical protein
VNGHGTVREGIVAGSIGATGVAVWFLLVDLVAGQPFFTPALLGKGVIGVLGPGYTDSTLTLVLFYTVIHYAAFMIAGVVATAVVHASRRQPAVLAGFFMLFVAFEAGFYGLTFVLSLRTPLRDIAWYQIGMANLVAAVLVLGFLWRRHPGLARGLHEALGDH